MPDPEKEHTSRPSLGAAFSNWKTHDAPVTTKLQMLLSNNLLKLRKRQQCCGHPGQPGC